jgi:formate dehydrogenase subunit beta
MTKTAILDVKDRNVLAAFKNLFGSILSQDDIGALLVPRYLPMKNVIMPTLVSDPAQLDGVDPLAPAFPMNSAKIASKLTRKPMGSNIAVFLRPCEIRAFVELVKLKQGNPAELLIIGVDCLGAYTNKDFSRIESENPSELTKKFVLQALSDDRTRSDSIDLAPACQACEYPVPAGADLYIGLLGMDIEKALLAVATTAKGEMLLDRLGLTESKEPAARKAALQSFVDRRLAFRDTLFKTTQAATHNLEKLTAYLAGCINCYNCRVACPVCYCKECVFLTDVFNHDPSQYLRWARRKGALKMPTDTVFYHLTRLVHMSLACVGCGQCSNACPNDIPVMELFRTISYATQNAFAYQAGASLKDAPPLSEFRENEFPEVVGIN